MHKKNLFYFIFIFIISILIYFLSDNEKTTIKLENNFSISDTASVNKIFIADRSGTTITLIRTKDNWIVNNKYLVRNDAINTILGTINQIKIQRPVTKNAFDKVVKNLATTGVKVEIYTNKNSPIKTYTIGGSTANHLGTYMLLENSETPFVIHIPSFNGFLSPRYGIQGNKINETDWRSTNIFSLKSKNISKVILNNIHQPEKSFCLITDSMTLINFAGHKVGYNKESILKFLNAFKLLNCESFKLDKLDIVLSKPIYELIVNDDTLRTFAIGDKLLKNKEDNFTVKRMHATLNNGEIMLIQDYVFNKVLITIDQLQ